MNRSRATPCPHASLLLPSQQERPRCGEDIAWEAAAPHDDVGQGRGRCARPPSGTTATADAAVPAPANNGSADAEGVEIPAPEPSGNKNLLSGASRELGHRPRTQPAPICRQESKGAAFVPRVGCSNRPGGRRRPDSRERRIDRDQTPKRESAAVRLRVFYWLVRGIFVSRRELSNKVTWGYWDAKWDFPVGAHVARTIVVLKKRSLVLNSKPPTSRLRKKRSRKFSRSYDAERSVRPAYPYIGAM